MSQNLTECVSLEVSIYRTKFRGHGMSQKSHGVFLSSNRYTPYGNPRLRNISEISRNMFDLNRNTPCGIPRSRNRLRNPTKHVRPKISIPRTEIRGQIRNRALIRHKPLHFRERLRKTFNGQRFSSIEWRFSERRRATFYRVGRKHERATVFANVFRILGEG